MTTFAACKWFIRKTPQGFRAICKGEGAEQLVGPRFATVNDARRYIASEFDNGTLSPAQAYQRGIAEAIEREGRRELQMARLGRRLVSNYTGD